ncbi:hypothetical protein PF007_g30991 [Phytophthora fragariae]|uniref:Jacalin-type lectin domain-containing protein n=2 Tax=Phytophthora fragariae TaxID=53985 RepID=A0A6A3PJ50_9STRA|nr:hypothetical protein PF007_g30991 [Phytophthora fragariae]
MKFLATVALIATGVAALENGIMLSETYGGPHGSEFSDMYFVSPGQVVKSITIRTGERVNGVGINFVDPLGKPHIVYHGSYRGDNNTLTLRKDEYVTSIEAHWGEYHSHTRVRFIEFKTSAGNTISGGTRATKIGKESAIEGYQVGGFFGTDGEELDSVGVIWTSITPVPTPWPTPVTTPVA